MKLIVNKQELERYLNLKYQRYTKEAVEMIVNKSLWATDATVKIFEGTK